jgi:FkbM family methyltransferase
MIVKNEEKNIEKALGWAKGIAFEQIVVDTGSTDRTVELAEKLGAKVYHFEWIDDFSAAKNFAIEQASGNWIAFLDADEYFSPKDAAKLMPFFKHIQSDPKLRDTWLAVQCPWVQVDEAGNTTSIFTQERLFRNLPSIRYVGKIHEQISLHVDFMVYGDDIAIIHTGYSRTSYGETNKAQRNIDMLRNAISENPENVNLKGYLAEALSVKAQMDGSITEALPEINALFNEVINTDSSILPQMKKNAFLHFIKQYADDSEMVDKCVLMCGKALENYPDDPDFMFYNATALNKKGDYIAALELLRKCEERLASGKILDISLTIAANPALIQEQISIATQGLSKSPLLSDISAPAAEYMRDAVDAVLRDDLQTALDEIFKLSENEIPDEHAESYLLLALNLCAAREYADGWVMFQKEYVRFLLESGRATDASVRLKELQEIIPEDGDVITLQESAEIALRHRKAEVLTEIRRMEEVNNGFEVLIQLIETLSEEELYAKILDSYYALSIKDTESTLNYYKTYPFWGAFDPENNVYDALRERARVLKEHREDFIWLYKRLEDARSKNVLYAILFNWICFDCGITEKYIENEICEYFHPDIFPEGDGAVLVDIGAFTGDSVGSFISTYGFGYKKIFCYEISKETFHTLEENLTDIPNVDLRRKAAGAEPGVMYIDYGNVVSSERVTGHGEAAVDVVRIDDDITEPVTFIKMDIEGAEKDALRGCERHIRQNHPRLAISTYHGYEDIVAIPRLIDEIAPGYKFYMRYHGGNLIPTEFSLLAVWDDSTEKDKY